MKNWSLALKIGGGFCLILVLLLVVSLVSWRGLSSITTGFIQYRQLARVTNLAGRLQANMLMARLNVKGFIDTGSAEDKAAYEKYLNIMQGFLDEAHKEIHQPDRARKIDAITADMDRYQRGFDELVRLYAEHDDIITKTLNVKGLAINKALAQIMTSAHEDQDVSAAYETGMVLRNNLLGRLYTVKFIDTNADEDFDRASSELTAAQKGLKDLDRLLQNSDRRRLMTQATQDLQVYIEHFNRLAEVIRKRNDLVHGTMNTIGPQVAQEVEDVKLSIKAEQDELGPRLQAQSSKTVGVVLIGAGLALLCGVVISIFLTRAITGPVGSAMAFVQQLAKGDFTTKLQVRSHDEIGRMIQALNNMVEQLGTMMRNLSGGINTLSSSSSDLVSVASQLHSSANASSQKSETVAAAAEEMSSNISSISAAMEESSANTGMVASSTEEMSATIGEIAQNAERARAVAQEAVHKSQQTSEKMNLLGASADRIGRVTETITEISEQTNLLALNATIEAARAGEAGKGFAVVANEIKELAKQTAEATVDIKSQISEMQSTTQMTVEDMNAISAVISDINEVIATIATSVEEQSAATAEISGNIAQVAEGIGEVNENIAQSTVVVGEITQDIAMVNQASTEVDMGSTQVQHSAAALSQLAEQLDQMVRQFKV